MLGTRTADRPPDRLLHRRAARVALVIGELAAVIAGAVVVTPLA